MRVHSKGTSAIEATIDSADRGGFVAIASTEEVDRDGERLLFNAFSPLPPSIPCHLDHDMRASNVVARAVPSYVGRELRIDARFGSGEASQNARRLLAEGLVETVSVVFLGETWASVDGVRTLAKGTLLACDLVSVPSNSGARVLSVRGYGYSPVAGARQVARDALLALARADATAAKSLLAATDPRGLARRKADDLIREALRGYR